MSGDIVITASRDSGVLWNYTWSERGYDTDPKFSESGGGGGGSAEPPPVIAEPSV